MARAPLLALSILLGSGWACTPSDPVDGDHDRAAFEPAPRTTGEEPPASTRTLTPTELDRRGDEHLLAGRFDDAIVDFDAFLAAVPTMDARHWRRGIAYYYAGRFEDGAAQFERHRTVNPNDVENAVWHFLCVARADGIEEARGRILPVGPDPRAPMREVYALFEGTGSAEEVVMAARASAQPDAGFYGHLYLALWFEAAGDIEAAREHIEQATTTHGRDHYMGRVARVHAGILAE